MIETARNYIADLKNELIQTYGDNMKRHFINNENGNERKNQSWQQRNKELEMKTNEEEEHEIIQRIRNNKKGGVFGKIMLTGMNILQQNNPKPVEDKLEAMVINIARSDDSMSGVTTTSKSTNGTISWDKDVQGRELTSESMKHKIIRCCAKYDIKYEEVKTWIERNVMNKNDPIHKWGIKQMYDHIEYEKWKIIIVDIKAERTRKYKEENELNQFDSPEIDDAIRNMPSNELIPREGPIPITQQASHLIDEELSHDPINRYKENRDAESGGQ